MTTLLKSLMPWLSRRPMRALEQAALRPEAAQRSLLADLLKRNRKTVFGAEHGFSEITGPQDYRKRVRVRDYEGFRPYVDRMLAGEDNVLTREKAFMYATTSGTTGKAKLIPINKSFKRDLAATTRAWLGGVFRDHPGCFEGSFFIPVSPAVEGYTQGGVPYGSMTGLTYQSTPWLFRRSYAVPYRASLLQNYDLRYYTLMRFAVAHDVTFALTANPSTWLRLAEAAVEHGSTMVQGIRQGNVGPDLGDLFEINAHDGELIAHLDQRLSADGKRAQALAQSVEEHGALLPKHAWPHLRALACWLGGSAGVQAALLRDYYGPIPVRDPGFRASEAMMSLPFSDHSSAGVLTVHVNYYEFIPEGAIDDPDPPILEAHELQEGESYYILLTTRGGLYRYDINDVIRVEGFYKKAPIVAFLRKGRDMVSLTGEKLHVNHVIGAVERSGDALPFQPVRYCLIPDVDEMRYDFLVEVEECPSSDVLTGFLQAFDQALSSLNGEYSSKRASDRLHAPRLKLMRTGWCEREKRREVANGKSDVQYKWPVIQSAWKSDYDTEVLRVQELSD